jgi:TRAP-type C4-dicarboxylate transport system permease small subunit
MLNQDNATARGVRTFIQAFIGFFVGLVTTVWSIPGVPEAVETYVMNNIPSVLVYLAIPSGLAGIVAYIWNRARGVR